MVCPHGQGESGVEPVRTFSTWGGDVLARGGEKF